MGSQFDLSGSERHRLRDHSIPHKPFPVDGPMGPNLPLTVFEILIGECDTMVDLDTTSEQ